MADCDECGRFRICRRSDRRRSGRLRKRRFHQRHVDAHGLRCGSRSVDHVVARGRWDGWRGSTPGEPTGSGSASWPGQFAALFAYTFAHQTHRALQSSGANGSFDLVGWLLTGLTLLLAGLISSWAGATLAGAVRPTLADAGLYVGDAIRRRRPNRRLLRRALMVAGVFVWLVVCVPVFGDMVNYTTDARMLHGGPQPSVSSPKPHHRLTTDSRPRPWLSWKPSGGGATTVLNLPVPWTGGASTTEDIGIYTPPGYDPHGQRRYPVLYEAPFDYQAWDRLSTSRSPSTLSWTVEPFHP